MYMEAIIQVIESTIGARDPYTVGHQQRVTQIACSIAQELGLGDDRLRGLRLASSLHDLGKVAVPAEILAKPGKLTAIEFSMIKCHPQLGYDILKPLELPGQVSDIILQHHERLDGSGYPWGLWGKEIILEARILGVADVVEAMCSHRPYRPALGLDQALKEISRHKGILYDATVVDACLRLYEKEQVATESPAPQVSDAPRTIPVQDIPQNNGRLTGSRVTTWGRRFMQETRFPLQVSVALIIGWLLMTGKTM